MQKNATDVYKIQDPDPLRVIVVNCGYAPRKQRDGYNAEPSVLNTFRDLTGGGEERRRRCSQATEADSAQLLTDEITRADRQAAGFFHHLNATLRASRSSRVASGKSPSRDKGT